jgi:DNA (cytosine-5)-methyltransferase 1
MTALIEMPSGILVPAASVRRYDRPVAIDLFCGAGGFSVGFHQAGFHVAAAVEYDPHAALTYLVNLAWPGVRIHCDTPEREKSFAKVVDKHLGVNGRKPPKGWGGAGMLAGDGWIKGRPSSERGCEHFWVADVRNLTGQEILDQLGLRPGEVTAICGGPPCQGFSIAGHCDVMDPRNSLVFEFMRLVCEIQPKTFVMENVQALLSMVTPEGLPVIDALCRVAEDGGFGEYDALRKVLRAQAGAGAALRRSPRTGGHVPEPAEDPDEVSQESLW